MDLATFWDCHRRAFAHFGGVPGTIVYDRTKTVIRRHVAPGEAVPLHPEAAAFADHYGFVIDVLAAYRPTGKGRVERQVNIVRDHVLAGRSFDSIAELDAAFAGLGADPPPPGPPHPRRGDRRPRRGRPGRAGAAARAAVSGCERHLRRVGKDCLVSFEASCYSVPARLVRPGQRVELQIRPDPAGDRSASTPWRSTAAAGSPSIPARRAAAVGHRPAHWDGLPDGHTRAITLDPPRPAPARPAGPVEPLSALLSRRHADLRVAARPLADYAHAATGTERRTR